MGISTHTKRLAGRIKKATSGVVKTIRHLHKGARKAGPALVEGTQEQAQIAKKGFLGARRSLSAMFRRPLSDISHFSIMIVIALALFSGFSTFSLGTGNINVNPLKPSQQLATAYVSSEKMRALEADSVATVAGWYSDKLGQDAAVVAEKINNDVNLAGSTMTTISTVPVLAVATTPVGSDAKIQSYVVQNGDTLSTIASKFNISTDTVRFANGITDADNIAPGQTLTILPVTGVLHEVRSGDTLAGIAARYEVAESLIISTNNLEGVDITEGLKLLIPDGNIPEAPKPVPVVAKTNSSSTGSGGTSGSRNQINGSGNFMFPTSHGEGYYNGYHNWAIDVPGGIGTPIYAADSGRIVEAKYGYNGGYGNTILVDHGNGYQTRYAHMSSLQIIDGYVSKGQVIGYMGSTGRSTGSHLHFEIITGGTRLNPCNFFGGCSG